MMCSFSDFAIYQGCWIESHASALIFALQATRWAMRLSFNIMHKTILRFTEEANYFLNEIVCTAYCLVSALKPGYQHHLL